MAYQIDTDINSKRSAAITFDVDSPRNSAIARYGLSTFEVLGDDERSKIPRKLWIDKSSAAEIDSVIGWSDGPFLFSEEARKMLEVLEPGVHEFMPIDLCNSGLGAQANEHEPVAVYYLLLAPITINAIVFEKTEFWKPFTEERRGHPGPLSPDLEDDVTLQQAAIQGHHFWRENLKTLHDDGPSFSHRPYYFCSDEFHAEFERRGLSGLSFVRKCVVEK